jgi:D-3-phosphoglycerate dehydrogenase
MKWKVLVSAPYMQPVIHRFEETFSKNQIEVFLPPINERMEEEELLEWIPEMDGAICGDDRFTEKVLRSAPRLKVISKWGTGIDSIDQDTCKKIGITICNTPNAFSEPVADSIIGYMLCFARNLTWMDKKMREGIWQKISGKALKECVLGVIGVGNVGKAVIRRATSFGMRILGNDIIDISEDFISETNVEIVTKEALLREGDFVSLNCNLNPTSYHLMSYDRFRLMKPTSIIINTARGPIINELDLVKALKEKVIAGAALDVFEHEPLPTNSPLRGMDNVMLAPHNANSSPQSWEAVHHNTIKNLIAVLYERDHD